MPYWLLTSLIAVFSIHFVIFSRLALRKHQAYYFIVSATFLLLIVSFSLRLSDLRIMIGTFYLHSMLRAAAWLTAAVSISLLLHRKLSRRSD